MPPRKIFLFALPRSGSTLLCDRLTLPGKGVVLHEPMILRRFGDGRQKRIVDTLARLGHSIQEIPPVLSGSIAKPWFDTHVVPLFSRSEYWGIKEVFLNDAIELVEEYRPDCLLLLWRDPRDVALSFLELMNRALMSYSDRKTLKDEAWALECLTVNAERLATMADRYPHALLQYEQLMTSEESRRTLLDLVGLPKFGDRSIAMVADEDQIRTAEVDRHDSAWSNTSVERWRTEPAGWRRTFADLCFSAMQPHASAAGYPGDAQLANLARAESAASDTARVSDRCYEPASGFDFAYAKRRGRRQTVRHLRPDETVLDVGGTTAALAYMTTAKVMVIDDGAAGKRVRSMDWKKGVFPNLDPFDACTFIASLEYISDPLRMIQSLLKRNLRVIITYHCAEDLQHNLRRRLSFRSDLTRRDWQQFASELGIGMTAEWDFSEHQSLIIMEPVNKS